MKRMLLFTVLLSLLVLSACQNAGEPATTRHELNITATAEGWAAPESVPAGWSGERRRWA